MFIQIIYALVVAFIYLAFNYDLDKTVEEQRELFTLGSAVFGGSFLLFYIVLRKPAGDLMDSDPYGSDYLSETSSIPFPE